MSSIAGKKSRVKVCTTDSGSFAAVAGVKSFNHSIDGASVDDSEMGVDWVQRIQGLKDGKLTVAGGYRSDDTGGQGVVRTALINDSDLFVQVLPDGSTGWQQQMRPTKFGIDATVEDKVSLSMEFEGTGAITAVS